MNELTIPPAAPAPPCERRRGGPGCCGWEKGPEPGAPRAAGASRAVFDRVRKKPTECGRDESTPPRTSARSMRTGFPTPPPTSPGRPQTVPPSRDKRRRGRGATHPPGLLHQLHREGAGAVPRHGGCTAGPAEAAPAGPRSRGRRTPRPSGRQRRRPGPVPPRRPCPGLSTRGPLGLEPLRPRPRACYSLAGTGTLLRRAKEIFGVFRYSCRCSCKMHVR